MTILQLAISWYVFIGMVWSYLVAHEYVTNGSFSYDWLQSKRVVVGMIVMMFVIGTIAWPASLWWHIKAGRLKDLFV